MSRETIRRMADDLTGSGSPLPSRRGRGGSWQVRLRWWVPPVIVIGVVLGRRIGFGFEVFPLILVAAGILAYNSVFALLFRRAEEETGRERQIDGRYLILQVSLDYAAMFLLIHFTGGGASPLVFFFILHVIFAAILFQPGSAWLFAFIATAGLGLLTLGKSLGWLAGHPVTFGGEAVNLMERPAHLAVIWVFFTASVFITAALTTAIMNRLRGRVQNLAEATAEVAELNEKLGSLYAMLRAVGSENRPDPVLNIVTSELSAVMDVPVVTVKLLDEGGKTLRYAAAHGLPPGFAEKKIVEVARSPLNRRIIEGETLVYGEVAEEDAFQLLDDLVAAGIQSVLFAPLTLQDRVIGILGAYSREKDHFGREDTDFFRLAAELAAIAIDNARAYEAVQNLMEERSRFMLQVAHNMRAPLAATISMLDVVRDGYLGVVTEKQTEYLRRMDRRLKTLNTAVGEFLTLARSRQGVEEIKRNPVNPKLLAGRIERTFHDEAARKGLTFQVTASDELPELAGDTDKLEQMIENLASNAVKYTPAGGKVEVTFKCGEDDDRPIAIEVRDTGIGIPREEQHRLFSEFFRAANARKVEEVGTGLGLAIVKRMVDLHQGRIRVESEEGSGTAFIIDLPAYLK